MTFTPATPPHVIEMTRHVDALYADEGVPIESVRDYLREQLERHPEEPEVWFHLATSYHGDPAAVAEHVARGVALAPDAPWVRYRAADVLFELAGDVEAAKSHLQHAVPNIEEDDDFLMRDVMALFGRISHREGNLDLAEELLRSVLEAEPDDADHSAALAWVLVAKRRFHEARTVAGRASIKHPDNQELLVLRTLRATDPLPEVELSLRPPPPLRVPPPPVHRPRGDP